MNKFIVKIFIIFFVIGLSDIGFLDPFTANFGVEVSTADAGHRGKGGDKGGGKGGKGGGGKCRGKKCTPPTVSELPIQYMVLSGAAVIALSGGTVFYIRKRRMKSSLEV